MTTMNLELARHNMVEQQIRTWEVLDPRVLDLVGGLRREDFVPPDRRQLAFADVNLPIGHGEVMMTPKLEARILQTLRIRPRDRILEVGTGSGFLTACLSRLGASVTSVDIHEDFTVAAGERLQRGGFHNVRLETGNAAEGWPSPGGFDAIVLTGSVPAMPATFEQQLRPGGRLFAIVGNAPIMEAWLITRTGDQAWMRESLFETSIPPLRGAVAPNTFAL
jgi:protein-L-isoaspartate(D-aspartate) O-methyltransferase